MSITTTDLITFAQDLTTDTQQQEVGHRAALSRAYYAAYHDCNSWHNNLPAPGSLGSSTATGIHVQLYTRLTNPDASLPTGDKTKSRQRAYALRNLHDRRTKADYHLDDQVNIEDAKQAITDAQTIIATV